MSTVLKEVLAANQRYVSNFGDKGKLPMPPDRASRIRRLSGGFFSQPSCPQDRKPSPATEAGILPCQDRACPPYSPDELVFWFVPSCP